MTIVKTKGQRSDLLGISKEDRLLRQKEYQKQWQKDNPDKRRLSSLKSSYPKLYNITFDQAQELLKNQNNKCKICGTSLEFATRDRQTSAFVDHCHSTLKVRGILCNMCNIGLGAFKDNPKFLENAGKYLNDN